MADPQTTPATRAARFVTHIDTVLSRDGGARRALPTGLRPWRGEPQAAMHKYVAPWLPSDSNPAQERAYYTVAALMTAASRSGIGNDSSIGTALGRASTKLSPTTTNLTLRKVARHTPAGPYTHLRGGVRLIQAASIPMDWARLLSELEHWHYRGPRICTTWQQDYYRAARRPSDSSDSE